MTLNDVLIALDLEATGMDPRQDQIIEVGAVKFRGAQILERFETYVRPDGPLSLTIRSLTGIEDHALERAPRIRQVTARLRDFVGRSPIVGQSVSFDLEMLAAAGLPLSNRRYDTFELATIMLPELPTYDLGTIARTLAVAQPERHRAVADAEMAANVFSRLVERIEEFDDLTLERMAELSQQARSQLAHVFSTVLRDRQRETLSFGGSSIGAALLAKLGGDESRGLETMFMMARGRPAKLERTGHEDAIDLDVLDAALATDGPFARTLAGFEARREQLMMMRAVAENLNLDGQLLVEAGTGTGKSLGYLLPAALHAVAHGDPVVISTATIALQDQLIEKDIPALQRAARSAAELDAEHPLAPLRELKATVLKGRSNYLCLRRWFLAQREPVESAEQAQLYTKVTAWLHHTESGDRAELRLTPEQQRYWGRLAEEEGACLPNQCIFHRRNQCFLFRGRNHAESAHLIIVNHSLLLSDLLRGGSVMPPFRRLVIDEAHHLEDEATSQAGFNLSAAQIGGLLRRVLHYHEVLGAQGALGIAFSSLANIPEGRNAAERLQPRLQEASEAVGEAHARVQGVFTTLGELIQRYDQDASGYERRVRIIDAIRVDPAWSQIEIEWDQFADPLGHLCELLSMFHAAVEPLSDVDLPTRNELLTELQLLAEELELARERGFEIISTGDPDIICWLSRHQTTGEVAINAAPLHVAGLLEDRLYRRLESLTLTSATLTTEHSFSFIRERLGLPDADELQVPSPFDYRAATLLGIVDDVSEPGQPGHQKQLQQALIEICRASGGRAMVLFTSHNALQTSYHAIKRPLERDGILVLGQRVDGSPRQLIERLRERPRTVLLGTNSFWEGVDIVGDALSLLVITRLPFPVPSDPIFAARSELFEDSFIHYAVPQAILRFEQGFGRLIRSARDRGACIVLDRRIISRRYGQSFVDSLPECTTEIGSTASVATAVQQWLTFAPDEAEF